MFYIEPQNIENCSHFHGNNTLLESLFNFTYRYITVLQIYNPDFENYLGQMYPTDLEIKDMTKNNTSVSYLEYTSVDRKGRSAEHFPLRQM